MPTLETMEFNTLDRNEVPIKIDDKDYTLYEASGAVHSYYQDRMFAGTTLGADGRPSKIEGVTGAQVEVVSRCLVNNKSGHHVPANIIDAWPGRVKKALFLKVKEISDWNDEDDEDDEPVKNSSDETTDGSDSPTD